MDNTFSIKEAISFGWTSFKKDAMKWIGILITFGLISIVIEHYSYQVDAETLQSSGSFFWNIIGLIVDTILTIGLLTITIKAVRNQKIIYTDLFTSCDSFKKFVNIIFAKILTGLVVVIGLIFLIVPGIIAAIAFYFAPYFVVVDNMGPIEAMKQSAKKTKGHRMRIFLFVLALIGVNILGALALIVGLLVTIPMTLIATAYVYDYLTRGLADKNIPEPSMATSTN